MKTKKNNREETKKNNKETERNQQKVIGIFIHNADCLNLDIHIFHPSVKVLFIDLENGDFITKQNSNQSVSSYQESHVKYILPLITQPFVYKNTKTLVPRWEELLIFNENFEYLRSFGDRLGIFYVIQDFVSMNKANNSKSASNGWRDVAWAFLKPFPGPGLSNVERKVRLQLFKPNLRKESDESDAKVLWHWWSKHKHVKYPSTLYTTVQAIDPPSGGDGSKTSKSMSSVAGLEKSGDERPRKHSNPFREPLDISKMPLWPRTQGQSCQIPKHKMIELESMGKGVSFLKFSREGRHLAMACPADNGTSVILIYDVLTWTRVVALSGHKGPIYELDWFNHNTLLSCSGDGTAQVWHLERGHREILEHPSFVYSSKFHPNASNVVVTGSYDQVIRIWCRSKDESAQFGVLQELMAHQKYITALEFDSDGQNLFSGDKGGTIRVWEVIGNTGSINLSTREDEEITSNNTTNLYFRMKKHLQISDISGSSIDSLHIHPGGRRLLINSSSMVVGLLMVDLTRPTPVVMQEYKIDKRSGGRKAGNLITPCGSYVFSGNQHFGGNVHVWDTDTAQERHVYKESCKAEMIDKAPGSVADQPVVGAMTFHPFDHMVVFGCLGQNLPACVFKYKKDVVKA